ncbi:unnamed protein product [Symbiodinium natans]|uniref:Uncharacterized protein n=1 Tax=Symbiodinium natans TaxID=878477 RepID=A0A812PDM2_9DINO|nr:unnamed protein product [Symbiodinium natans]
MTAAGGDPASSSESSSSSLDTSDSSSSRSLSSERSQHEERSDGEGTSQGRQSSERSSSGTPSVSTPTVSGGTSLTPGPGLRARPGVPDFHAAVLNVVDMLHTTLACQVETEAQSAKSTEDSATQELQRIPSLQSLLKLKDGDVDELMGRPRRPSQGEGAPAEAKRPSHFRDRHGRMRHNWNSVNFETLALGMRQQNDKKAETELEKHWGDIAGKLAFVLTRLEQVVPMSKSRLLNEALGTGTRRMSEATMQVMEGVLQSRVDLGGLLQALSRSDPMRLLKDSANVSIFARLEEFAAYEKAVERARKKSRRFNPVPEVREHQIDSPETWIRQDVSDVYWMCEHELFRRFLPEMVHLVLQRWSVQQGGEMERG